MRKIIFVLALLLTSNAYADTCATNMMPAFTANQAVTLCTKLNDSIAESLIPQTTNAIDLGSASKVWRTLYTGTSRIALTSDILRVRQDAQRLFTWDASSDVLLTQTFGDAGTTAVQFFTISASTADADDDSTLVLAGGGAAGGTRGATITLPGEEVSGGSDITIDAGAGDTIALSVGGTAEITAANDSLTFSGAAASIIGGATSITIGSAGSTIIDAQNDPQRLFTFSAASDTALTQTFGDAGVTAAQTLTLLSSTADADDDSYIAMCGGGANSTTRGACIQVYGNETSAGAATVTSGGLATSHINFDLGHASSTARVRNTGGNAVVTMTNTGEVTSAGTSSIGWAVVAGADTACNTTCTSACVFGVNTASLTADIVDCADATADECMCAGAS